MGGGEKQRVRFRKFTQRVCFFPSFFSLLCALFLTSLCRDGATFGSVIDQLYSLFSVGLAALWLFLELLCVYLSQRSKEAVLCVCVMKKGVVMQRESAAFTFYAKAMLK